MKTIRNSNGERITKSIRREGAGWGVSVWFGGGNGLAINVRRYVYGTRAQALRSDISHDIGRYGRIA